VVPAFLFSFLSGGATYLGTATPFRFADSKSVLGRSSIPARAASLTTDCSFMVFPSDFVRIRHYAEILLKHELDDAAAKLSSHIDSHAHH